MPQFTPDIPRIRDAAQAQIDRFHLPGVGLGIVTGGELVHAEGFGWADIAGQTRYTPEHRHRIGSITKTMVGLCAMALVDEGRLSLDANVPALVPDITFHGPGDSLKVWHLMTHTGGIGEAPNVEDLNKPFDKLFYETDPSVPLAELYTDGITIEVPPGSKWAYANHGFALLGGVSRASVWRGDGGSLPRRHGFSDGRVRTWSARVTQASTAEARSMLNLMGVQLESDEPVDGHNLPGKFVRVWGNGGAGAVQSTVLDMATYATALLRRSLGVVKEETFKAMTSDQYRPDKRLPGWGLSFGVHDRGPHRGFGHGGAVFGGWNSYLGVYPDLNAAIVLHTNLMSDDFDGVVVPTIVNAFLGFGDEPLPAISIDATVLDSAAGVYELPDAAPLTNFRPRFNPGRLQIARNDGSLTLYSRRGAWADGCALFPATAGDPELFAVEAEGYPRSALVLKRGADGRVNSIRLPRLVEMVRNPDLEPWA
jgi:CubicO group peptidase (beta-lactamase class C family)